jgi:uncharacterized membrane protein YbaN (DUF454 family)
MRFFMTEVSFADGRLVVLDRRVLHHGRPRLAAALLGRLAEITGVAAANLDLDGGTCVVRWDDPTVSAGDAATAFITALAAAQAVESADDSPLIVRGPRRLLFLAAGGGCLVMTVVGAILPGVPTVPFLFASSYYLARSSRRLHAALSATPVFGKIVREWESHRAISRESKWKIAGLTIAVVLVTISLTQVGPAVVAVVAVVVSTTMVGISRLPEIGRPEIGRPSDRWRFGGRLTTQNFVDLVACRA